MCRSSRWSLPTALVLGLASILGLASPGPCAEDAADKPVKAVLWIGGFAHEFDEIAKVMTRTLPRHVPIEIEVVRDGRFLDAPDAKDLDVILMNHCHESTKDVLTDAQKQKLLDVVRGGVGVVAIHASYYSFLDWDAVHELHGTRFIKHGEVDIKLTVTVVDRNHPITKDLPETFETHGELYQSEPLAKDCHLLARAKEQDKPQEYPSVWTKQYGRGRVAVILPAHWLDAYEKPDFQKLIANSARWASRRSTLPYSNREEADHGR
jgi:type 1 glutamine amidotransferase